MVLEQPPSRSASGPHASNVSQFRAAFSNDNARDRQGGPNALSRLASMWIRVLVRRLR